MVSIFVSLVASQEGVGDGGATCFDWREPGKKPRGIALHRTKQGKSIATVKRNVANRLDFCL